MTKRKETKKSTRFFSGIINIGILREFGWAYWILILSLALLSFLAGANFESEKHIYVADEIAREDVVAPRDLRVIDEEATRERKKQALALQPPVYDWSMEPYSLFQTRIVDILRALNTNPENLANPALQSLSEEITLPEAKKAFPQLEKREVQSYLLNELLPQIRDQLEDGLVVDWRSSRVGDSGMYIRNLDNKTEHRRSDIRNIPDVKTFLTEISTQMRQVPELDEAARHALGLLLQATVPVSLSLNREATQKRATEEVAKISPVYYQMQKGEVILRKGEKVNKEQQIKLQWLYNNATDPVYWKTVGGSFIIALLISFGFFITPGGKAETNLRKKDLLPVSVILLVFGLGAKGIYIFGLHMGSTHLLTSLMIAYPAGGCVGLCAMVLGSRRYVTMGLLMSMFCMLMFQGNFSIFIYYFLGSMLAIWLVVHAQSRQEVIWSIIPYFFGLVGAWSGIALLASTPILEVPQQLVAILINSLLCPIILFAFSPVLEMAFGYSTRFRLMELMSLEQPLMQEIMFTIPGTYHHSLVVANMVEAGAKAIGANSLLCKVAALYHDAGKLTYPEYFIENQFGGPNKHNKLAPSMSALILLSHVKKGTELAEKYKLGQEIIDIIRQHHGTRIMKFFYQKAIDLGEKPNEADYSYPGPRPQSKEAGILMLADAVEASSRTLTDPTPARIKNHIDNIVKGIFAEGQLDESELTFKDLHFLSENFQRILTGIFHQRIAYPENKIKDAQQKWPDKNLEKNEKNTDKIEKSKSRNENGEMPIEKV